MKNINVGILGHVDSGKTSLAKALSTHASTASFDKSPQSKERGITLDLGFSSLSINMREFGRLDADVNVQITLVDCPGHASLIRTILGGAQIVDMAFLVIDVTKGIQTQTAECVVIAEIVIPQMIIVLNKIDLIPETERHQHIEKLKKRISAVLSRTKFVNSPFVSVSAHDNSSVSSLLEAFARHIVFPQRSLQHPFLFAIDHGFQITGHGTILTGTVLSGYISVNDNIEIPSLRLERKVKSLQMFHKTVQSASQGDRVALCVTQLGAQYIERGIACSPHTVPYLFGCVANVNRIPHYKNTCTTGSKLHVCIGHETVMAEMMFFSSNVKPVSDSKDLPLWNDISPLDFYQREYDYEKELPLSLDRQYFVLLSFEHAVPVPMISLLIACKLDVDVHLNQCRIAFHGKVIDGCQEKDVKEVISRKLKLVKYKEKKGEVDRILNENTLIGKNLFSKQVDMNRFVKMVVILDSGKQGYIESSFGNTGKFRAVFPEGIDGHEKIIYMKYKQYVFDKKKQIVQ